MYSGSRNALILHALLDSEYMGVLFFIFRGVALIRVRALNRTNKVVSIKYLSKCVLKVC